MKFRPGQIVDVVDQHGNRVDVVRVDLVLKTRIITSDGKRWNLGGSRMARGWGGGICARYIRERP